MPKTIIKCHIETSGDPGNLPLIFFHGFMGSAKDWNDIIQSFNDKYYCVALDLPGHGQSRGLTDGVCYDFNLCAHDVTSALELCGINNGIVVSYSMGARIALFMAVRGFFDIKGIICESVSVGISAASERQKRIIEDCQLAKNLRTVSLERFLVQWYKRPLFKTLCRNDVLREQLILDRMSNDAFELAVALEELGQGKQPDLWKELGNIQCPALFLAGNEDEKFSQIIRHIKRVYPIAETAFIKGGGHNLHLEKKNEYVKLVQKFLRIHGY